MEKTDNPTFYKGEIISVITKMEYRECTINFIPTEGEFKGLSTYVTCPFEDSYIRSEFKDNLEERLQGYGKDESSNLWIKKVRVEICLTNPITRDNAYYKAKGPIRFLEDTDSKK
jgi:hypothetical protein